MKTQRRKRPSYRSLRAAQPDTMEEAASILGVSIGTVRNWQKQRLPLIQSQKPFLILGDALKRVPTDRTRISKVPLEEAQLYCPSCKVGQRPLGMLDDCLPNTAETDRLLGLCEACGGTCNRMISKSKLKDFEEVFVIEKRAKSGPLDKVDVGSAGGKCPNQSNRFCKYSSTNPAYNATPMRTPKLTS